MFRPKWLYQVEHLNETVCIHSMYTEVRYQNLKINVLM